MQLLLLSTGTLPLTCRKGCIVQFHAFSFSVSKVLCPTLSDSVMGFIQNTSLAVKVVFKKKKKSVSFPNSVQVCLIGQYFWIQGRSALKVA